MQTERKNLTAVSLLLLAGCATAPISGPVSLSALTAQRLDMPAVKLADSLAREAVHTGLVDGYRVRAVPITRALIEARESEEGYKKGLSDAEVKDNIRVKTKMLVEENTTFEIAVKATTPDAANLTNWGVSMIDAIARDYPMKIASSDTMTDQATLNVSRLGPGLYSYVSHEYDHVGIAYTQQHIDLSQHFRLRLQPRYEKGLDPIDLSWTPQ